MNLPNRFKIALVLFSLIHCLQPANYGAGARQLVDLNPGSVGSYPSNFTSFGGEIYFSAYTLATGMELWRYNGTEVSLAADINETMDDIGSGVMEGNDSIPDWLIEFNGQLYFSAFDSRRGAELWRWDGIQAARVSDINPDASDAIKVISNSSWPNQIVRLNNALYFSATSATTPQNYELWRYDGVFIQQVANLHPEIGTNHSSYPTGLTTFNNALFFMADDGVHGWELWRHNGSEATMLDLNPGGPESSSYPKHFTVFNNQLYFQAFNAESGFELWKSDGATATIVTNLVPGAESSFPHAMAVFNGAMYFCGSDPIHGAELRKFDGTLVTLAADINPAGDSYPKNLTVLGNLLVFTANDGLHGWELWKFDGTSAELIGDLNPAGDAFPENFKVNGNALYFTATTPDTGYELWKFNGNGITLAADANPGPGDSFPRFLTSINGQLFFSAADDGFSNWEIWVLESGAVNQPPAVLLTAPANGASFSTKDTIEINATATDDGGVNQVEFYSNGSSLGVDGTAPYGISVTLPAGNHVLTARAVDNGGAQTTSTSVDITVRQADIQPPQIASISRAASVTSLSLNTSSMEPHILEVSVDLKSWSAVITNSPSAGTLDFSHPTTGALQFYRVVVR